MIIGTEFVKFIICCLVSLFQNKWTPIQLIKKLHSTIHIGIRYLIPAFLYCLYNNLSFINLTNYDPTTYFILLQLRNVVIGFCFQFLFEKKLTKLQWFSLILLTIGCMVKEYHPSTNITNINSDDNKSIIIYKLALILFQIFCSCFASVYSEYLLKYVSNSADIFIQNIFMYADSILCNFILLYILSQYNENSIDSKELNFMILIENPFVLIIVINGAIAGITTSFFLKKLNSIIKTFAATLEIILSAIISYFLFSIPIDIQTVLSILIIFFAFYAYLFKPVQNEYKISTNNIVPLLMEDNLECNDEQISIPLNKKLIAI